MTYGSIAVPEPPVTPLTAVKSILLLMRIGPLGDKEALHSGRKMKLRKVKIAVNLTNLQRILCHPLK
ncbi:MAG: hypothetical protein QXQ94_09755 [Candidatus Bathyarchaeia archaeon]|nr:hypothetical protein [Candidatus Bathyarchaeota archaeon]